MLKISGRFGQFRLFCTGNMAASMIILNFVRDADQIEVYAESDRYCVKRTCCSAKTMSAFEGIAADREKNDEMDEI